MPIRIHRFTLDPDPDPVADPGLGLKKSIQTSKFFHVNQIYSDIFMLIFLPVKI